MPIFLTQRRREEEWMDRPDVSAEELRRSLLFIRGINRVLGYTRATLSHLQRFSRSWKPGERISIVDFATGSADIPRAIVRWGQSRGFDVRAVGVDLHPTTARVAAELSDRIQIVRADVLRPPFEAGAFDYAITNMFLHHLDEDMVVQVMRNMDRVARRGVIVADLLRHDRAYAWIWAFTLFSSPMLKHDARVSVAQAFTRQEIERLRDRAGVGYATYHRHFGHRFVLAGEKMRG